LSGNTDGPIGMSEEADRGRQDAKSSSGMSADDVEAMERDAGAPEEPEASGSKQRQARAELDAQADAHEESQSGARKDGQPGGRGGDPPGDGAGPGGLAASAPEEGAVAVMATRLAKKPVGFIEEAGKMFGVGLEALHTAFRRPWPVEEFVSQMWFLIKVTTV